MQLADLPTPAVLVERARLHDNITRMQTGAAAHDLLLRPHAKTHKSPAIARWQLEAGATGITVAKVGEAEVFADAGVTDIRLAYPVAPSAAPRVIRLMERARVSIIVDHPEVAARWSATMIDAGRILDVLVKVDVGFHRCGIDPGATSAVDFVIGVGALSGLRFRGLLSHAGHSYGAASVDEIESIARDEAATLSRLADRVRARGAVVQEISVGSTPTAHHSLGQLGLTELRPGNYVFFDLTQVALGAATVDDCALSVLATVVSMPSRDRIILDAGSKTLSSDIARGARARAGYGGVCLNWRTPRLSPDLVIERLSEEHAVVLVSRDQPRRLAPGDRVRVIPNHACVVTNLTDLLRLVDGDDVIENLPVVARGKNS